MTEYSIIPSSGHYGLQWPSGVVIPQGFKGSMSYGGWTVGNEGFIQQTFLGASIRSFDLNAGFGDTTTSLSVSLVEDEYNKSDGTELGLGDDPYHNGIKDIFQPPIVGSPVFFKFGKNFASVEQAWRKTFDDSYNINTLSLPIVLPQITTHGDITSIPAANHFLKSRTGTGSSQVNIWEDRSIFYDNILNDYRRGHAHFVFGGILQSYTQNRGPGGNPVYSVNVQDPREVLSNATMILNNYAGSTHGNKNLFNIYGFLEYDVSDSLQSIIDAGRESQSVLKKVVNPTTGAVSYIGVIEESTGSAIVGTPSSYYPDLYKFPNMPFNINNYPPTFPVTGQGYARRSDQGIPIYRVFQAMEALFEFNGTLPDEYASFGSAIDFRGYKYVVDWSGIPTDKIPPMYFMDFDQIDMLSFAQELCDIISHDMFVSLFPVIDHPACSWLYQRNQYYISTGQTSKIVAGIIRIDTIDKSKQPSYGAIKKYLDDLDDRGIHVENQDVGYEVSNVTTDKFLVGAQEVEMYYFHSNKDRDNLQLRRHKNGLTNSYEALQRDQWSLQSSLKQQILPFYGFLGKEAVTIPRGWGSYQQILLDTTGLDAFGVGNYYVTTEMELRAAATSYDSWVKFLLPYNERYVSEVGENQQLNGALTRTITPAEMPPLNFNNISLAYSQYAAKEFAVDVPRCVFNSDRNYMDSNGYPASPCSPPFGYPLYFKRAEKIGIPQAGYTELSVTRTQIQTSYEKASKLEDKYIQQRSDNEALISSLESKKIGASSFRQMVLQSQIDEIATKNDLNTQAIEAAGKLKAKVKQSKDMANHMAPQIGRLGEATKKNSIKVYNFLHDIASKYLGKKFLVKIPKMCNINYSQTIVDYGDGSFNIQRGPFGFRPQPISQELNYYNSSNFQSELTNRGLMISASNAYEHYLDNSLLSDTGIFSPRYTYGALKGNFNPISENWEFNYKPEPQGGFFNYALFDKNLSFTESSSVPDSQLPLSTQYLLTPKDLTNFINDNGRISCYARYNNSQFLNLSSVGKENLTQEKQTVAGFIPDILEDINNLEANDKKAFDAIQRRLTQSSPPQKAVAFVKCELDEKFYMPPKTHNVNTRVFGRKTEMVTHDPMYVKVTGVDINGCVTESDSVPQYSFMFIPDGGGDDGTHVGNDDFVRIYNPLLDGEIIRTDVEQLDSNNVYAIITVPGRIEATQDQRYMDGVMQAMNAPVLKNALTVDVVKGVLGFELPSYKQSSVDMLAYACAHDEFTATEINSALMYYSKSKSNLVLGQVDYTIGFSSPSPVHPDIVAIPLMSLERCYGPWQSASVQNFTGSTEVRYSNIGGKIEFVKDEGLAPWNYAGYQLMNEAGSLKAQFSNSLLLFMERGGFVMPEAPTGISLAKALISEGPLVTSISVSIDESIRTTVKMDLYTSRFGKLQKQKEDAIGKAVRERQKMTDEKNALIRKGMGKSATSADIFGNLKQKFANLTNAAKSIKSETEEIESFNDKWVISAASKSVNSENKPSSQPGEQSGGITNTGNHDLVYQNMDWMQQNVATLNSAGGAITDVFQAVSYDQDNPNMPSADIGGFDSSLFDSRMV